MFRKNELKHFAILVHNGYRFEYAWAIDAHTSKAARAIWLAKCAPSQRIFRAIELKNAGTTIDQH